MVARPCYSSPSIIVCASTAWSMYLLVAILCMVAPGLGSPPGKDSITNNGSDTNNNGNNGSVVDSSSISPSSCTCVPYFLCNDTAKDDALIDINGSSNDCDDFLKVCCRNVLPGPGSPDYRPVPTVPGRRCGGRNKGGVGFQVEDAGGLAQFGEFPWVVAVRRLDASSTLAYQGGGSLIHPRVVLTAAHLVKEMDELTVTAGEWDARTENEIYPTQDLNVSRIIIHENYNKTSLANDVALLVLETPVDMSLENVGLICLPEGNENMDGRDCVTTAWGKDSYDAEGKVYAILKSIDQPVVAREPCQDTLQKTRLGSKFQLHESFMCAGANKCQADGGHALACPSTTDPDVYVQAGIVAWSINCDALTVYVNVSNFVNWVDSKLREQGISLN